MRNNRCNNFIEAQHLDLWNERKFLLDIPLDRSLVLDSTLTTTDDNATAVTSKSIKPGTPYSTYDAANSLASCTGPPVCIFASYTSIHNLWSWHQLVKTTINNRNSSQREERKWLKWKSVIETPDNETGNKTKPPSSKAPWAPRWLIRRSKTKKDQPSTNLTAKVWWTIARWQQRTKTWRQQIGLFRDMYDCSVW